MFKFRLEKLLNYRKLLEEQAKTELAKVMQELIRERNNAEELEAMIQEANIKLANTPVDDLNERILFESYLKGLYQDHSACNKKIKYWLEETNKAKSNLLEKSIEKKTIEKLKENQAAKYAKEQLQIELKFNDEISARILHQEAI